MSESTDYRRLVRCPFCKQNYSPVSPKFGRSEVHCPHCGTENRRSALPVAEPDRTEEPERTEELREKSNMTSVEDLLELDDDFTLSPEVAPRSRSEAMRSAELTKKLMEQQKAIATERPVSLSTGRPLPASGSPREATPPRHESHRGVMIPETYHRDSYRPEGLDFNDDVDHLHAAALDESHPSEKERASGQRDLSDESNSLLRGRSMVPRPGRPPSKLNRDTVAIENATATLIRISRLYRLLAFLALLGVLVWFGMTAFQIYKGGELAPTVSGLAATSVWLIPSAIVVSSLLVVASESLVILIDIRDRVWADD